MNEICEDYVDPYLSKEAFLRTYSIYVEPVNGDEFWPNAGGLPILSPKFRIQLGRPRLSKRKRDVDGPSNPTKLSRKHAKILCSKCGRGCHNKRTCKSQQTNNQQVNPSSNNTIAQVDANNVTRKGGRNKTALCKGYKVPVDKLKRRTRRYNEEASITASNISQVQQARGSGSTNPKQVQDTQVSSQGSVGISEATAVKLDGGRIKK